MNKTEKLIVLDASNLIVGRFASWVAKQALLGNKVAVVNSEKAIITGDKYQIAEKYRYQRREIGKQNRGPFISRLPDRFLRRIIKKMLPFKKTRGREAFQRVMCYLGVPEEFKGKAITLKEADVTERGVIKFTSITDVIKSIGGKR